ncbi:MAG: hypothetical protein ACI901_001811 [Octadecabacter sp.]|jgi:hypothetical protein
MKITQLGINFFTAIMASGVGFKIYLQAQKVGAAGIIAPKFPLSHPLGWLQVETRLAEHPGRTARE